MITCDEKALYYRPVLWVFDLIKRAYTIDVVNATEFTIKIGSGKDHQIQVLGSFYKDLLQDHKFVSEHYFKDSPLIFLEDGSPDYLSTIFYLVNGFQEFNLPMDIKDKYGRLYYKSSLQSRFDMLKKDLVKEYIQKLLFQIDNSLKIPLKKSRIFVSHDIDSVFGSLKYDGLWALKNGNLLSMMQIITRTLLLNPPWFNIDKIAKLEDEHDIKACYYWIVQNGRDSNRIKNGDYSIRNRKIQTQMEVVKSFGNEVGLHKSTMSTTFEDERGMLAEVKSNRFHFLKINNPDSFTEMEKSGITSDSSIGFPYSMGFKNSFGMPYYPYDIVKNEKVNVLEIPLQIMDGMFEITNQRSGRIAYEKITDFIEKNNTNAIISILWHNSEMTDFAYRWSFDCYKRLLQYFVDSDFETVLPSQLVKEYENVNH